MDNAGSGGERGCARVVRQRAGGSAPVRSSALIAAREQEIAGEHRIHSARLRR